MCVCLFIHIPISVLETHSLQWDWNPVTWQHSFTSQFFNHLPWLMITMVDASIMTDLSVTIPIPIFDLIPKSHLVSDKVTLAEGTENFALSDLSGLRTPIVETYWHSTHSRRKTCLSSLSSICGHPCGMPSPHPRWLPQSIGNGQSMDWRVWNAYNKSPKTLCSPAMVCRCPHPGRVVFSRLYIIEARGMLQRWKNRKDN